MSSDYGIEIAFSDGQRSIAWSNSLVPRDKRPFTIRAANAQTAVAEDAALSLFELRTGTVANVFA